MIETYQRLVEVALLAKVHPIDAFVGQRVRERRLQLALGLEALGKLVGVSGQQIQKYENGRDRVSAGRLFLLAAALRVSVKFFFLGLPQRYSNVAFPKVNGKAARPS